MATRRYPWLRYRSPGYRALWVAVLSLTGCDPFHVEFAPVEPALVYRATTLKHAPVPASLRVLNYNVKFGGGRIDFFFDCHGSRVLMEPAEVETHLTRLAKVINQLDPDVLFIQEVDIASKRSAYVDQLQWLLDHTELNHAVYASQWRADYVPSDGIGAVDSGNAILSRWPLLDAERLALPLRSDLTGLDRYFYLHRNLLRAYLKVPGHAKVGLLAVHAEAYAQDGTKLDHIQRFEAELAALAKQGPALGAGDLNAIPPGSEQTSGFDDSACTETYVADDYSSETKYLLPLFRTYNSDLDLDAYQANNERYFSHTTLSTGFWNRRLDYIFSTLKLTDGVVYQSLEAGGIETMPVSDHAPVGVSMELPE
jgi:endonuclease/exonuclease/phosphatase family metal-dependent hydrolase